MPQNKKSPAFLLNWWFLKRHKKNGVQKSSFLGFNSKKSTTKQRSQHPPQPQPKPRRRNSLCHLPQATRDELHEALKDAKVVSKEKREKLSEALRSTWRNWKNDEKWVWWFWDPWGYGSPKFQNGQKLWLIHDPNYLVKVSGRKWMDERLGSAIDPNHWS